MPSALIFEWGFEVEVGFLRGLSFWEWAIDRENKVPITIRKELGVEILKNKK